MKTNQRLRFTLTLYLALSGASGLTVFASPFQSLGFDNPDLSRILVPPPNGGGPSIWITPDWTTSQQPVGWNQSQFFGGVSSILDVNFRDRHFGLNAPAPVVGNFSLGVWPVPGGRPFTLTQTGDIPADAQSLQFFYQGGDLRVFIAGIVEPVNFIGTHPTDNPAAPTAPYYAVDVSPFAGKTAELRFEFRSYGYDDFSGAPYIIGQPNAQSHVLDDLKFSALPASVPSPATCAAPARDP